MICERCHKKVATLKYTEVVKGKAILRNICEACLAELRGDSSAGFEMAGAPSAHFHREARADDEPFLGRRECPNCGVALREVVKHGRAGCPECFNAFEDVLDSMISSTHVAPRHRGKIPNSASDAADRIRLDLRSKRALLRSALKTEDYEEAAVLRDSIKELEAKLDTALVDQD